MRLFVDSSFSCVLQLLGTVLPMMAPLIPLVLCSHCPPSPASPTSLLSQKELKRQAKDAKDKDREREKEWASRAGNRAKERSRDKDGGTGKQGQLASQAGSAPPGPGAAVSGHTAGGQMQQGEKGAAEGGRAADGGGGGGRGGPLGRKAGGGGEKQEERQFWRQYMGTDAAEELGIDPSQSFVHGEPRHRSGTDMAQMAPMAQIALN